MEVRKKQNKTVIWLKRGDDEIRDLFLLLTSMVLSGHKAGTWNQINLPLSITLLNPVENRNINYSIKWTSGLYNKMVLVICFPEFPKLSNFFGITGTKPEGEDMRLIVSFFGWVGRAWRVETVINRVNHPTRNLVLHYYIAIPHFLVVAFPASFLEGTKFSKNLESISTSSETNEKIHFNFQDPFQRVE